MRRFRGYLILFLLFSGGLSCPLHAAKMVDAGGREMFISPPYTRIISLYGAHTENLLSLGLRKEIIGVSRHEAYPPEATRKPAFSYHDDAEKFLAAHPDLILIRPMIARGYPKLIQSLKRAGIMVISLQPLTIQGMMVYWKDLGVLTGKERAASRMITRFKKRIDKIRKMTAAIPPGKRKRVYFESIHARMKTFTPDAMAIFALTTAGGINIASDTTAIKNTNIAAYGKERILSHAGEIDVYLAQKGAMNRISRRKIYEEGGFKAIKAVKQGQVYIIDEKIVSRPTLRLLSGIYEIGRFLYPGVFNDVSNLKHRKFLTRSEFAGIMIKMTGTPIKTPDYRHDVLKKRTGKHRYGEFTDVDYAEETSNFIETAIQLGLFREVRGKRFYPDRPILRKDVAYGLFIKFDLPEPVPCRIRDVTENDPLYPHISAVAGLGIMPLTKSNFFPDAYVSGEEAYKWIKKAMALSTKK